MRKVIKLHLTVFTFDEKLQVFSTDLLGTEESIEKALDKASEQYFKKYVAYELLTIEEKEDELIVYFWGLVFQDDVREAKYDEFEVVGVSKLSDKQELALERLRHRIDHLSPYHIPKLLGKEFTINDLYKLYTSISDNEMDKGNFHKLVKDLDYIEPTGKYKQDVDHRPPQLYRFKDDVEKPPIIF